MSPRLLAATFALTFPFTLRSQPPPSSLKWNLQLRTRAEIRENLFDFDASHQAETDDAWLLTRARIGFDWQPTPSLQLSIQGQDARESFSQRPDIPLRSGAEGDDAFDLRLASLAIGTSDHLRLTVGRQALGFGDERLVGPLEWLNFSRTFDAVTLRHTSRLWSIDAFTASVVHPERSRFNRSDWLDPDSRNQSFSGLYFSSRFLPFQATDLYAFHLHEAHGTDFATTGFRLKGDPLHLNGWDYTIEATAQFGNLNGHSLAAAAHHLEGGYQWTQSPWKPRLALEYSFGSGDRNPSDNRITTFQNLFPTNHPPYGLMDLFSWQNQHNAVIRLAAHPHPKIKTTLDLHAFWLASTADAWYRANGTSKVRTPDPDARRFAGSELDFTASLKINPHADLLAGYSHFFAGSYLADTGAHDDANFGYLMITLNY